MTTHLASVHIIAQETVLLSSWFAVLANVGASTDASRPPIELEQIDEVIELTVNVL